MKLGRGRVDSIKKYSNGGSSSGSSRGSNSSNSSSGGSYGSGSIFAYSVVVKYNCSMSDNIVPVVCVHH